MASCMIVEMSVYWIYWLSETTYPRNWFWSLTRPEPMKDALALLVNDLDGNFAGRAALFSKLLRRPYLIERVWGIGFHEQEEFQVRRRRYWGLH